MSTFTIYLYIRLRIGVISISDHGVQVELGASLDDRSISAVDHHRSYSIYHAIAQGIFSRRFEQAAKHRFYDRVHYLFVADAASIQGFCGRSNIAHRLRHIVHRCMLLTELYLEVVIGQSRDIESLAVLYE